MHFYKEWVNDPPELDMVEKDTTNIKAFNHFDLADAGSRYFFQKRFGVFELPSSLYANRLDPKADYTYLWGTVRKDSIFFTIQEGYYTKNDSEKHFIKIESVWGYAKGLHTLAKELEAKLSCLDVSKTDSIVAVKYLLEKTENLHTKKQKEAILITIIQKNCSTV